MSEQSTDAAAIIEGLNTKSLKAFLAVSGKPTVGRIKQLKSRANKIFHVESNLPYYFEKLQEIYKEQKDANPVRPLRGRGRYFRVAAAADSTTTCRPRDSEGSPEVEVWPVSYPRHPDVHFKPLPFHYEIADLVKPSSLSYEWRSRACQLNSSYSFTLTPHQTNMIESSLNARTGEYGVQVLIRFCLLETTSRQDDYYPPGLQVWVNSQFCNIQASPATVPKLRGTDKRICQPVNVTSLVKLDPYLSNAIRIQSTPDFNRFVVAAYLVEKKDPVCLLQALPTRVAFYTKGMIQQKLNVEADSEIATTCLRVSLVCPLGKIRIVTPCRALTCDHLQCFDASLYIQMNEKKTTWKCPVCDKSAHYDNLVVDNYFVDVLKSPALPDDCKEIQLLSDGDWIPFTDSGSTVPSFFPVASTSKVKKSKDSVDLSSDDECAVVDEKQDVKKVNKRPCTSKFEEIDLASSSESREGSDDEGSSHGSETLLPFKKRKTAKVIPDVYTLRSNTPSSPSIIDLDSDSDNPPEYESSPAQSPEASQQGLSKESFSSDDVPLASIAAQPLSMPIIDSSFSLTVQNNAQNKTDPVDDAQCHSSVIVNAGNSSFEQVQPTAACTVSLSDLKDVVQTTSLVQIGSSQSTAPKSGSGSNFEPKLPEEVDSLSCLKAWALEMEGIRVACSGQDDLLTQDAGETPGLTTHGVKPSFYWKPDTGAAPKNPPNAACTDSIDENKCASTTPDNDVAVSHSQPEYDSEESNWGPLDMTKKSNMSPSDLASVSHLHLELDCDLDDRQSRPCAPDLRRNPLSCSPSSLPSPLPPMATVSNVDVSDPSTTASSGFSRSPSPDANPPRNPYYRRENPAILRKSNTLKKPVPHLETTKFSLSPRTPLMPPEPGSAPADGLEGVSTSEVGILSKINLCESLLGSVASSPSSSLSSTPSPESVSADFKSFIEASLSRIAALSDNTSQLSPQATCENTWNIVSETKSSHSSSPSSSTEESSSDSVPLLDHLDSLAVRYSPPQPSLSSDASSFLGAVVEVNTEPSRPSASTSSFASISSPHLSIRLKRKVPHSPPPLFLASMGHTDHGDVTAYPPPRYSSCKPSSSAWQTVQASPSLAYRPDRCELLPSNLTFDHAYSRVPEDRTSLNQPSRCDDSSSPE